MDIITLLILAIGLSMDAFAASICKGLVTKKWNIRNGIICGLWFGGFQALMPVLGYFLGNTFAGRIEAVDHWIAFFVLGLIGINMIRETLTEADSEQSEKAKDSSGMEIHSEMSNVCECEKAAMQWKSLFLLAVATSIDAFAVGVTFALMKVNILYAASIIGIVTFAFSFAGVYIGNRFGSRYEKRAKLAGGTILILLGIKMLLDGLGIL